jgi:hypothetical protein
MIFLYVLKFLFEVKTTDDVLNKVEFLAEQEAIWGSGKCTNTILVQLSYGRPS